MYRRSTFITDALRIAEPKVVIGADDSWVNNAGEMTTASPVTFAHFSLDGRLVISSSKDRTTRTWSATDGSSSRILEGYSSVLRDGTFLSDDNYVVCYTDDGPLVLWDRKQAKLCGENTTAHEECGRFRQIFSSTREALGFFTSHTFRDAE